jgi:anti-sigma B factor antagonist
MEKFEVVRNDNEAVSVLNIRGYLDAHTAPEFEDAINKLMDENRYKIVVDLTGLQYISSAGLGVFMGFIEEIRQHSGDIKLSSASPKVYKVFDLLGFPSLYEFYEKLDDAVIKSKNDEGK